MCVSRSISRFTTCLGTILIAVVMRPAPTWAQHSVPGVGPINRSMGGAAVAAPIDAAGAIYWNPATIGDLGKSEMEFGGELVIPQTTLASRVGAGAFGQGFPPTPLAGSTEGDNG